MRRGRPVQAAAFTQIPPPETGHASAIFTSLRYLGSAAGVAAVATTLTAATGPHSQQTSLHGHHVAFTTAAIIALLAAAVATTVRDSDALPTTSGSQARAAKARPVGGGSASPGSGVREASSCAAGYRRVIPWQGAVSQILRRAMPANAASACRSREIASRSCQTYGSVGYGGVASWPPPAGARHQGAL